MNQIQWLCNGLIHQHPSVRLLLLTEGACEVHKGRMVPSPVAWPVVLEWVCCSEAYVMFWGSVG